jgi:myo-inositol-1(or 4)-monophosphatase
MDPLLNIAIDAARNAGKIILRYIDRVDSIRIDQKSRHDFVTEVDKASEQTIIQIIQKKYPNHRIIAEESGLIEKDKHADVTWIIDPLDGTTNYIHGFPQFSVSIAVRFKDQLQQGVIYDPIRDELFSAGRGQGAKLNDKRLRVSSCTQLDEALLGTGFSCRAPAAELHAYFDVIQTLAGQAVGLRRAGSAALDLAYVAAGRLDGFWEMGLKIWDMAAGALLIKEAGGMVADNNGDDDYLNSGRIVAGNPKVFKAVLAVVQEKLAH